MQVRVDEVRPRRETLGLTSAMRVPAFLLLQWKARPMGGHMMRRCYNGELGKWNRRRTTPTFRSVVHLVFYNHAEYFTRTDAPPVSKEQFNMTEVIPPLNLLMDVR